jgi:hypothetical protein
LLQFCLRPKRNHQAASHACAVSKVKEHSSDAKKKSSSRAHAVSKVKEDSSDAKKKSRLPSAASIASEEAFLLELRLNQAVQQV